VTVLWSVFYLQNSSWCSKFETFYSFMVDVWSMFTLWQKPYNWIYVRSFICNCICNSLHEALYNPAFIGLISLFPVSRPLKSHAQLSLRPRSVWPYCILTPPGATLATPLYFIPSLDGDFSCRDQWLPSRTDLITMRGGQWQIFVAHLFRSTVSWLLQDVSYC
jgi:hypothetical protein